jgi:hypothetical protein
MNITDQIKELLINKPNINDDQWSVNVSYTNAYESKVRIGFTNDFQFLTLRNLQRSVRFNIIFFAQKDGSVYLDRIEIKQSSNQNCDQRSLAKDKLIALFDDVITELKRKR